MGKKIETWKKESIWLLICCVISFLLHAVVVNQLNGWFCTDSDGYWLHAATFTGHDWSGVASKVSSYYAWGYSVILIIPFLISNDILVMSKIVVLMNALFCTLTVPLLYSIGKKIFDEVDKRIVMVAALITSLYSSYFLHTGVALVEVFIYFLYVLLIWLVWEYMNTEKWYWVVLSSMCCGYLYITHHRNLGMVVAFVILIFVQFLKKRNWKELLCFFVPLVLMLGIDTAVNNWLTIQEATSGVYKVNTYSSVNQQVFSLFSLEGIISLAKNMLGQVWYMLAGTFTIVGVGALRVIRGMANDITKSRNEKCIFEKKFVFGLYLILNVLMMMGISAVFWVRSTGSDAARIDGVFYGRYFESTISILLFCGLVALSNIRTKKNEVKELELIVLITICLSVLVHFFTQEISGNAINDFSVVAVMFPFSYPNVSFSIMRSSICLLCIAIVIIKLFLGEEVYHRIFAYLLVAGSFLYIGYNVTINVREIQTDAKLIQNFPIYNEEFCSINGYIEDNLIDSIYVYTEDGYVGFAFQLFNLDVEVTTIRAEEELEVEIGEYVVWSKRVMEIAQEMEILVETENYALCRGAQ